MRILFATDGSEGSAIALDLLLALPHRAQDHVDVISVPIHHYVGIGTDGTGVFLAEIMEEEVQTARRVAADSAARLTARGVTTQTHVLDGPAPQAIIAAATSLHCDLIVVGTRGLGRVAGALLGSTARALARHSPVPVLVVRDRREAPRRILVATDASEDSRAAIATLAALPLPQKTEITLLHVVPDRDRSWPVSPFGDELRATAERAERTEALEVLRLAAAMLPAHVSVRIEVERGAVADRVLAFAGAMGSDLVVLGSRGTTLGGGFIQGSTADRVLAGAHCAVLVARAHAPSERPLREEEVLAATAG